jgi:DNA-binding CsgD family transcriptional regulator
MATGRMLENCRTRAEPAALLDAAGLRSAPLDEGEIRQLLRYVLEAEPDDELLALAAGAAGNPRLLAEFALGLRAEGISRIDNGVVRLSLRRVPGRVLEFVMHRLVETSGDCQQFLKVAAAFGKAFVLEDVSSMLDRSSATLLSALDEAISAGFVIAGEQHLEFPNDFLVRGIIESIPAPARDSLWREAKRLSGRRAQECDWVSECPAEPYGATGPDARRSPSPAHSLIMNGEAAAGVRVAESVLAGPATSLADRLDAEASVILGTFLLGGAAAERMAERILGERAAGRTDVAASMALTARSNLHWRAGELAEGLRLGRAAVRNSKDADPRWRLHFLLSLAGKFANLRDFEKAESLIDEAEAGLRGLPTPVWLAAPAVMRSRLFLQSGRIGDASREAESATAAGERDAVPMLRPLAYSVLSAASFYMGDLPGAIENTQRARNDAARHVVLTSAQYAWTELLIAVKRDGPRAAARLLSGPYSHLPTHRSLYIEVPSAAAFMVLLARDVGDIDLERSVLATVDGLAADNPGVPVVGLTAMHANALANSAPAALALIIVQSPDPISVALATEELAKLYAAKAPVEGRQPAATDAVAAGPRLATCWSELSDMEQRIAYLVSVGLTNRQIAKQVHLSAHTVNYHLRKIYKKLGINTRVELAHGAAIYTQRAAVYSMGQDEAS